MPELIKSPGKKTTLILSGITAQNAVVGAGAVPGHDSCGRLGGEHHHFQAERPAGSKESCRRGSGVSQEHPTHAARPADRHNALRKPYEASPCQRPPLSATAVSSTPPAYTQVWEVFVYLTEFDMRLFLLDFDFFLRSRPQLFHSLPPREYLLNGKEQEGQGKGRNERPRIVSTCKHWHEREGQGRSLQ